MLSLSNKKKYFYQLQINQKGKEIGVSLIKACNYFFKYILRTTLMTLANALKALKNNYRKYSEDYQTFVSN